ncbi:MAG: deoxyguanosinetriphosphate triphosphohydrolase family protein, partial [Gemmataceae bacterium]
MRSDIKINQVALYGYSSLLSLGREYPEGEHEFRSPFERDRDRVVHSTAFRRLAKKTQVFPSPTNDHHRTRLTHTIEVAQISRVVARNLGLEEDLTEAIALAHDLGHPPFGHAGEEELANCMDDCGGFEHNTHALRIVTRLEYRYPAFMGLNLTWEVREAFAHHSKKIDSEVLHYRSKGGPFLEAQVADAVDSLAYDAHDVEDAITAGLVSLDELLEVQLVQEMVSEIRKLGPMSNARALVPTLIRNLINRQAGDLIIQTRRNIAKNRVESLADVRAMKTALVANSPELLEKIKQLEIFLKSRVYHHHRV